MFKKSRDHYVPSGFTYWSHFGHAAGLGFLMIWYGVLSIIHAIIPALVPFGSARFVVRTYWRVLHNHPAPEIRKEYVKVRTELAQLDAL
jgi:hypothetical protein